MYGPLPPPVGGTVKLILVKLPEVESAYVPVVVVVPYVLVNVKSGFRCIMWEYVAGCSVVTPVKPPVQPT